MWKAGKQELNNGTTYQEQYDQGALLGRDGSPSTFSIIVLLLKIQTNPRHSRRAEWAGLCHSPVLGEESTGLLMTIPAVSTRKEMIPKEEISCFKKKKKMSAEQSNNVNCCHFPAGTSEQIQ